jgi:serine/threonine-protein kinase
LVGKLAEDVSGSLWTAVLTGLAKPVTIRLLSGPETRDPAFGRNLSRRMQAMFPWPDHPNVAAVFNYGHDERARAFFVLMEPLSGETLGRRIENRPCLPPPETLGIAAAVARGLEVAHGRGIAHGRLGPDSVMLTVEGGVKLLDLGLPPTETSDDATEADVAALAGLVHRMLVEGPDIRATDPASRATGLVFPGLPAEVQRLLEGCLDPDPVARPTVSDLASALGAAAHPVAAPPLRTPSPEEAHHPPASPAVAPSDAAPAGAGVAASDSGPIGAVVIARERPERRRRAGPWMAGVAALAVVVAIVSVVLSSGGAEEPVRDRGTPPTIAGTTVPDVLGRPLAEAEDLLTGAGLQVARVRRIAGKPGVVVRTDPTPGEAVRVGASVTVFVGEALPSD